MFLDDHHICHGHVDRLEVTNKNQIEGVVCGRYTDYNIEAGVALCFLTFIFIHANAPEMSRLCLNKPLT